MLFFMFFIWLQFFLIDILKQWSKYLSVSLIKMKQIVPILFWGSSAVTKMTVVWGLH